MAMKAMRCPQCGSELELDDSKEFGFCSSCGTKIMLHEKVEMKHTGSVQFKMDNSDQGHNRITLGNRAYSAGNYGEAYEYFTKGLEDVPNDFYALYRKGICAVCLGTDDNLRLGELQSALIAAHEILDNVIDSADENDNECAERFYNMSEQFNNDLEDVCTVQLQVSDEYYSKLANLDNANHQAAYWCETAVLFDIITTFLTDEEIKENLLNQCIQRLDFWLNIENKGSISYYTHTTTDKNGVAKDHYSAFHMGDTRKERIMKCRAAMADRYNNLSSRLEREREMNDALSGLQAESDQLKSIMDGALEKYNNAKDAFWNANPEYAAQRDKQKNLTWISVGVGGLLLIVGIILKACDLSAIYPIIGGIAFVGSFFVRNAVAKKLLSKMEDQLFPADVKALGAAFTDAQKNWFDKEGERRNKQSELSAFESSKK